MRRDLKHAVGRRVADRLSGLQVQLAELFDDFGARGMAVAEYAGNACLLHQSLDELWREAGLCPREIAPVEADRDPGDFPMSGRRILPFRLFAGAAKMQAGAAAMLQSCGLPSGCKVTRCAQPEFHHPEKVQQLLELFEQSGVWASLISSVLNQDGVQIIIGDEAHGSGMASVGVVLARYGLEDQMSGVLGVVGPVRMPYSRSVSTVRYMSQLLSDLLYRSYNPQLRGEE